MLDIEEREPERETNQYGEGWLDVLDGWFGLRWLAGFLSAHNQSPLDILGGHSEKRKMLFKKRKILSTSSRDYDSRDYIMDNTEKAIQKNEINEKSRIG